MENEKCYLNTTENYPFLCLPKGCTTLNTNSERLVNVSIYVNTSQKENTEEILYKGLCNILKNESNSENVEVTSTYGPTTKNKKVVQNSNCYNKYTDDELECSAILCQLSKEIVHKKETHDSMKPDLVDDQPGENSIMQLISASEQSTPGYYTTELCLENNNNPNICEQTLQNISVNNILMECSDMVYLEQVVTENTYAEKRNVSKNIFHCSKCKRIFDHHKDFKQHIIENHRNYYDEKRDNVGYTCAECGKTMRNEEKFEQHCLAHNNPDFECTICHKVFATKYTLRTHVKIHYRKFSCNQCARTFNTASQLYSHRTKAHRVNTCETSSLSQDYRLNRQPKPSPHGSSYMKHFIQEPY